MLQWHHDTLDVDKVVMTASPPAISSIEIRTEPNSSQLMSSKGSSKEGSKGRFLDN